MKYNPEFSLKGGDQKDSFFENYRVNLEKKFKKEVKQMKAKIKEKSVKKESKKPEQTNLFGDQDFVYNVLQTELSDIVEEMMRTREAISKKEEKLEKLKDRKEEVYKATKIVADQKDRVKKEAKKEVKQEGTKKEKA